MNFLKIKYITILTFKTQTKLQFSFTRKRTKKIGLLFNKANHPFLVRLSNRNNQLVTLSNQTKRIKKGQPRGVNDIQNNSHCLSNVS